jgi:hypothetical protein
MSRKHLITAALVVMAFNASPLHANGYVIACGRDGEVTCEPGGNSDCPTAS